MAHDLPVVRRLGKGESGMKKLLVVVDYQNDFINGSLGFPGAEALDAAIAKKVTQ